MVKGRVTDEGLQPLPGAHIMVDGSKGASVTDNNGNYNLLLPCGKKHTLIVSFVGMKPYRMEVNIKEGIHEQTIQTITLSEENTAMDEVW